MQNLLKFPGQRRGASADEMMASEMREMYSEMGGDSPEGRRHEESMWVALSDTYSYWIDLHSGIVRRLTAADIARLDSHAVADYVAADLGPEARAGVERIVANLIAHARKFLGEYQAPPTPTAKIPGLRQEIVRGTIEVNVSIQFAPD